MFRKLVIISAWISILIVCYATVANVDLVYSLYFKLSPWLLQPNMRSFARVEHIVAFAGVGSLFCFAYPDRIVAVSCAVLMAAGSLEYLQTWTVDRHGTVVDGFEKMAGVALGIFAFHAIRYLEGKRQTRRVK